MKVVISSVAAFLALTSFADAYSATGKASYYGGRGRTASGAHVGHMTAAHRSLPFGTHVRVTNLHNQRSALVTVNDRGPFIRGRIIDVSTGAAGALGMRGAGVAPVRIEVVSAGAILSDDIVRTRRDAPPRAKTPASMTTTATPPTTSLFGSGDSVW